MILISHRGNLSGPNLLEENLPIKVQNLLSDEFHVEIDVWLVNGDFYLGHDSPQYKVFHNFLRQKNLWCHAKNLAAFERLLLMKIEHVFWHQEDDFALTSSGFIWTYPGREVCEKSIIVCKSLEEQNRMRSKQISGLCSDWIMEK